MDVTFETAAGWRFTVEIWFMSTVTRMKMAVEKQERIPVESQRLFFKGSELQDDLDTEHYGITEGSLVRLLLPNDDGYARAGVERPSMARVAVDARALGSVRFTFNVGAGCTVARLKGLVKERSGCALPATALAMMFRSKVMADDETLVEHAPRWPVVMDVTAVVRR